MALSQLDSNEVQDTVLWTAVGAGTYLYRNAAIGSILIARTAGISTASNAISVRSTYVRCGTE